MSTPAAGLGDLGCLGGGGKIGGADRLAGLGGAGGGSPGEELSDGLGQGLGQGLDLDAMYVLGDGDGEVVDVDTGEIIYVGPVAAARAVGGGGLGAENDGGDTCEDSDDLKCCNKRDSYSGGSAPTNSPKGICGKGQENISGKVQDRGADMGTTEIVNNELSSSGGHNLQVGAIAGVKWGEMASEHKNVMCINNDVINLNNLDANYEHKHNHNNDGGNQDNRTGVLDGGDEVDNVNDEVDKAGDDAAAKPKKVRAKRGKRMLTVLEARQATRHANKGRKYGQYSAERRAAQKEGQRVRRAKGRAAKETRARRLAAGEKIDPTAPIRVEDIDLDILAAELSGEAPKARLNASKKAKVAKRRALLLRQELAEKEARARRAKVGRASIEKRVNKAEKRGERRVRRAKDARDKGKRDVGRRAMAAAQDGILPSQQSAGWIQGSMGKDMPAGASHAAKLAPPSKNSKIKSNKDLTGRNIAGMFGAVEESETHEPVQNSGFEGENLLAHARGHGGGEKVHLVPVEGGDIEGQKEVEGVYADEGDPGGPSGLGRGRRADGGRDGRLNRGIGGRALPNLMQEHLEDLEADEDEAKQDERDVRYELGFNAPKGARGHAKNLTPFWKRREGGKRWWTKRATGNAGSPLLDGSRVREAPGKPEE